MQGMIQVVEKQTLKIIAANVRRIRESYGWTQAELAEEMKRPQPRVSEIEVASHPITTDTIDTICDALGIDQRTLLTPTKSNSE